MAGDVTVAKLRIPVETNADKATGKFVRLEKQVDKTGKTAKKTSSASGGFGQLSSMLGLGLVGAATAAGMAMLSFTKSAISAASASQETANKFNVVFSSLGDEATKASKNIAKSFGMANEESARLLSNTGDLLTGFGMSQKAAFKMSKSVTKLAADLGSFNNLPTKQASEAITKALLGERESMKSLGISIREADIQSRLAARGTKHLTGEALMQEKALITLNLAMSQSKNALGDFARSQDSLANQTKIVNAKIENFKVGFGKPFVNVLAKAMKSITGVEGDMESLGTSIADTILKRLHLGTFTDIRKQQEMVNEEAKKYLKTLKEINTEKRNASSSSITQTLSDIAEWRKLRDQELANAGKGEKGKGGKGGKPSSYWKGILAAQKSATSELTSPMNALEQERIALKKTFDEAMRGRQHSVQVQEQIMKGFTLRMLDLDKRVRDEKKKRDEEEAAREKAKQLKKLDDIKAWAGTAIAAGQMIADAVVAHEQAEIDAAWYKHNRREEMERRDKELLKAKTDEERTKLKEKYAFEDKMAKRQRKLERDAAIARKAFAIADIGLSTSIAIMKTYATYGWTPVGIAMAALQGIQGAIQLAAAAAVPIPKAQFGGNFEVPAGNQADSGLLRVNQGEQVSVKPVNEGGGMPGNMTLNVDGYQMDAWLVDKVNQGFENGKIQIRRQGAIKVA